MAAQLRSFLRLLMPNKGKESMLSYDLVQHRPVIFPIPVNQHRILNFRAHMRILLPINFSWVTAQR